MSSGKIKVEFVFVVLHSIIPPFTIESDFRFNVGDIIDAGLFIRTQEDYEKYWHLIPVELRVESVKWFHCVQLTQRVYLNRN